MVQFLDVLLKSDGVCLTVEYACPQRGRRPSAWPRSSGQAGGRTEQTEKADKWTGMNENKEDGRGKKRIEGKYVLGFCTPFTEYIPIGGLVFLSHIFDRCL